MHKKRIRRTQSLVPKRCIFSLFIVAVCTTYFIVFFYPLLFYLIEINQASACHMLCILGCIELVWSFIALLTTCILSKQCNCGHTPILMLKAFDLKSFDQLVRQFFCDPAVLISWKFLVFTHLL